MMIVTLDLNEAEFIALRKLVNETLRTLRALHALAVREGNDHLTNRTAGDISDLSRVQKQICDCRGDHETLT